MITLGKLEEKIEKLTERLRTLNFDFKNAELQKEAEDGRDEAIDLLENYLELATQDWENRSDKEEEDFDISS